VGTFMEGWTAIFGWNETIFRSWYISGALLGGAPLAQGTVYLGSADGKLSAFDPIRSARGRRANPHVSSPAPMAVHPKLQVAAISIGANAGLVATELAVALATGSLSVLADAFHSGVDLTGSVVALAGIRMALRFADRGHAYGYECPPIRRPGARVRVRPV